MVFVSRVKRDPEVMINGRGQVSRSYRSFLDFATVAGTCPDHLTVTEPSAREGH